MKKYRYLIFILIVVIGIGVYKILYLRWIHSSFENYYAFRRCQTLIDKNNDSGTCKLSSGEKIKIVKFQEKWYLDGDLPCGFLCF